MPAHAKVLVSACLLGVACRYDGTAKLNLEVLAWLQANALWPVPVCPEQLGGLATPRPRAWFTSGDGKDTLHGAAQLIDENGTDVGEAFRRGAQETLKISRTCQCTRAILKQRSPSCGSRQVDRNGNLVAGVGVTCALLLQSGLQVVSEENLDQLQ